MGDLEMAGQKLKAQPRFTYIACDASFDQRTRHAAVAACLPGRPLGAKIIECCDANAAELAAIRLAMDRAATERIRIAEFRCDSSGVVNAIDCGANFPGVMEISKRLAHPPLDGLWRVELVHRSHVNAAHRLAALVWKAWVDGRESIDVVDPVGAAA
jgi:ribonuclease HI